MFGALTRFINRLLPFATRGTPLIQDLLHLAALCTALYYAPQIQAWYQNRSRQGDGQQEYQGHENQQDAQDVNHENGQAQVEVNPQVPRQVLVEDDDDDEQQLGNPAENVDGPLFAGGDEPEGDDDAADGAPGPAGPRPTHNSRTVGAKKAKSLARKDQRRAYHEFMRSQGEAQRARDAEGAREREALLAEEKARRAAAEAEVEARRAKEREEKRERELKAQREEMARRERAVALVRQQLQDHGICDTETVARTIGGGADRVWVENLVKASGLLSESRPTGSIAMLTETGWVVEVSMEDMQAVFATMLETGTSDSQGRVSNSGMGIVLEDIIRNRVKSAA